MQTARRRSLFFAVAIALAAECVFPVQRSSGQAANPGAPADPIKDRLVKAKREYSAKIDNIKKEVLESIANKITAARKKKNNSDIVAGLTAETEAFEKDLNQLPPSLGKTRASFEKRKRRARFALAEAYGRAASDYTKEGKDAAAKTVKTEQAQFLLDSSTPAPYQPPPQGEGQAPAVAQIPPEFMIHPGNLVHSEWNFIRLSDAGNLGGAFKILDGVIYHLDANHPIGQAALDGAGQLHLSFRGHRKIPEGEAVVRKLANGEFRGVLIFNDDLWGFSMSRR
jgi:hypothetical protein